MNTWDKHFFKICDINAEKSKDPSSKFGAVAVDDDNVQLMSGYNGMPIGFPNIDIIWNTRELKYKYIVHAEANLVSLAARKGISLNGSRLYVQSFPCNECAKLIAQAGIKEVVIREDVYEDYKERWAESIEVSKDIFYQVGVTIRKV